jgi:hypothetical protein
VVDDMASVTSHVHGGDLLPLRDLSLFLIQLVPEADELTQEKGQFPKRQ